MPEIPQNIYEGMHQKMSNGDGSSAIPLVTGAQVVQLPESGAAAVVVDPVATPIAVVVTPGAAVVDPATLVAHATTAAGTFDPNSWLDQQSGGKFKSWEEVQAQLNRPLPEPIVTPLTFANDNSRRVYELLSEGKEEEVLPYIQSNVFQKKIATMQPEDILKAKIAAEYPSLSPAEVVEEFNTRYVPDGLELDAVVFAREEKKAKDRIKRDANEAITYFSSTAQSLKLPPVVQPQATAVQPLSPDAQLAVSLGESFATDKVSTVPFEFAVADSQIRVHGQTVLPKDAIDTLQAKISGHPEAFLAGVIAKRWGTANGTLDSAALARDIYALDNLQQIGNKVAEQTYNQAIIEKIKTDKNYQAPGAAPSGGFTPDNSAEDAMSRLFRVPK